MLSESVTDEYRELFVTEARENIIKLNNLLLKLEKEPSNKDVVDEVFRITHLLKGSSAMMGIDAVTNVAHEMEDILDGIRKGKIKVSPELIDSLLYAVDKISTAVEDFSKGKTPTVNEEVITRLKKTVQGSVNGKDGVIEELRRRLEGGEVEQIASLLSRGLNLYLVHAKLPGGMLSSINAFKAIQKLSEKGEVVATIPDGEKISSGSFGGDITLLTVHPNDQDIRESFKDIADAEVEVRRLKPSDLGLTFPSKPKLEEKSELENVEVLIKKVERTLTDRKSVTLSSEESIRGLKIIEEVRVKVEDLDRIFTLVGELVLIRNRLLKLSETQNIPSLRQVATSLNQTTNELYNEILKIRLLSVGQIFNLFPRLVRDLARNLGKEVDLILEGEDVSLDRTIIEELVDPLVGLLRNAVDHGIESPQERRAKGKPRVGTIKVSAKREGELTLITVEDDGRGIDLDLVKRIAVKKGFISKSTAENLSDNDVLNLLYLPGFTAKDKVSLVSGRGMGLNAIKQQIESLGGYLEVQSEKDKGTKFTLVMPTNVTILTVLLVKAGGEVYAIPSSIISSIIRLDDEKVKRLNRQSVVVHRGKIIPVYSLSRLLDIQSEDKNEYCVVIRRRDRLCGISVSALIGFEDVVVKSVGGEKMLNLQWLSSVTILNDGSVALIIDPWNLIAEENEGWRNYSP